MPNPVDFVQLIDLATSCWQQDAAARPDLGEVESRLARIMDDLRENRERFRRQTSRRRLLP